MTNDMQPVGNTTDIVGGEPTLPNHTSRPILAKAGSRGTRRDPMLAAPAPAGQDTTPTDDPRVETDPESSHQDTEKARLSHGTIRLEPLFDLRADTAAATRSPETDAATDQDVPEQQKSDMPLRQADDSDDDELQQAQPAGDAIEQAARIEELIARKTYFLPINETEKRKTRGRMIGLIILLVATAVVAYVVMR